MNYKGLLSISPVDGRYVEKTKVLQNYFSEYALIRYRVLVEVEYFIALCEIPLKQLEDFKTKNFVELRKIYQNFSFDDALRVKEIEKITNHDVKAVEYFLKERFSDLGLEEFKEFIHFGLTSQDINNTAVPLSIKDYLENEFYTSCEILINKIDTLSETWKDIAMLARTHGQPASPTRLGKEINVFAVRLKEQLAQLKSIPCSAKFGGATGNFNAHFVAYPEINWNNFAENFVIQRLGLKRSYPTTQIEHYDNIAAQMHAIARINTILIDLCRDFWTYISMDYFKQKIKKGEVGSSAMPHKVNPIDFENAEGNLGIANALASHLAEKLPVSRLQRDLTDSTVIRNVGMPFAHARIAYESILKGLDKLLLNKEKIKQDLEDNWIIIAEAIQTILRREKYPNPYEALKELTRTNQKITPEVFEKFIDNLNIDDKVKNELKSITPFNYTGI
ncbi:MAG: adenylosuccinate lyase [Bacteroidales bacterium]|nr:adenylosuccinate lyase [Bacteroidales bacterium]HOL97947.1 adenylosuccinate lyase [Bacteroidales bacterium]HOM36379.1 adenylosuccinate lyase [Bacteroidales bacterium]HRT79758.1 adenylosuccinate lyase [Bacteroidales bacterium]HUM32326.1 adenylosuccinate lyase [Bacteroidales bacterium]